MIHSLNNYKSIQLKKTRLKPFDDKVINFLYDLHKNFIIQKDYPEIAALGFWLRKSNIKRLRDSFEKKHKKEIIFPRGLVFHISPSNVDTIFLYSLILSLLAGNSNILRISDRFNPQLDKILSIFLSVLKKYNQIRDNVHIVRYGYEEEVTKYFSSLCDARIIWGGDETIRKIRSIPIPPTAIELTFADKFSFMAIDGKKVEFNDLFFEKFYRDSYTFLQNACSSVRCVCWLDTPQDIREEFWEKFKGFVENKHPTIEAKHNIDKLTSLSILASKKKTKITYNLFFHRINLQSLEDIDEKQHCGFGLFYEVNINSLEEIFKFASRKHQTLVVAGIDKQEIFEVLNNGIFYGIDRVVEIGKAMEFSEIWDGFDILSSLVRIVNVDI